MIVRIQSLGHLGIEYCRRIGQSGFFLLEVIVQRPRWLRIWPLLAVQLYRVGLLSLAVVLLSALFIGMVVSLQGYHILQKFGALQELAQLLALTIIRELGPVITALLFAGRAGSALTAEIGLMRATDQLECMETMGVDPLWRVIAPRFLAGLIALPLLTLLFNLTAIYGGHLVAVGWIGLNNNFFWSNMQAVLSFRGDILNGVIKSMVFALIITWIALYQGYYAEPNAAGMSRATTKTVVHSSTMVLALDFILTALMMGGW